MAAVKSLCTRGIVMENGKVVFEGGIEESVGFYHNVSSNFDSFYKRNNSKEFSEIVIDEITIKNELGNLESHFQYDQNIIIDFKLNSKFEIKDNNRYKMFCTIVSKNGQRVCSYETNLIKSEKIRLTIEAEFLVRGEYFLNAFIHVPQQLRIDEVNEVCLFEILDEKSSLSIHGLYNYGQVFGKGKWDSIF
jgi:lipopolysaccharide transport system ATP-binding protein